MQIKKLSVKGMELNFDFVAVGLKKWVTVSFSTTKVPFQKPFGKVPCPYIKRLNS
jgi:hypothetical protein